MVDNIKINVDADLNIKGVNPKSVQGGKISFDLDVAKLKAQVKAARDEASKILAGAVPAGGGGKGGAGGLGGLKFGSGGDDAKRFKESTKLFLQLTTTQNQAQQETKKLSQDFLTLAKSGKAAGNELDAAFASLTKKLEAASVATEALNPAAKQLLKNQANIIKEETRLREQALREQNKIREKGFRDAGRADITATKIQFRTARELGAEEIKRLDTIRKTRDELKALESLQRAGVKGVKFPKEGLGGTVDSRGLVKVAPAIDAVGASATNAGGRVKTLSQLVEEVGRKAGAFRVVATAINGLVNITKSGAAFIITFNDSLLELNKILQTSDQDLYSIGRQITGLSSTTGVAVEKVVEITQEFARAGLTGRGYGSVLELTETALRGVQGTTLDAAQATQIMIQLIGQIESGAKGLNKELITTGQLFDLLGKAEDITAAKASDVQDAFKRSAAVLLTTGSSAAEVISLISVLQERTQRGGEVIGTALKTIASRITATNTEASRSLQELGINVVDKSTGNIRNFIDVLFDLGKVFKGLTEEQQRQVAVQVAGVRQVEIFIQAINSLSRVQQVNTDVTLSYNDAARKQAIEQKKLGTIINQIKTEFFDFINTLSSSDIGTVFSSAIGVAKAFLQAINFINEAVGGRLAQTFAALGLIKIFQGAIVFAKGLFPAIRAIAQEGNRVTSEFLKMGKTAQLVGTTGVSVINSELQRTISLQGKATMNFALMKKQAELAALGVAPRTLIKGEPRQASAAQSAELSAISPFGKQKIVTLSKDLTIMGAALEKAGSLAKGAARRFQGLISNTFVASLVLGTAAGSMQNLSDKARAAGDVVGATAAQFAASATEFASIGILFGPKGALVGAIIGGLKALLSGAKDARDDFEKIRDDLIETGQIKTKDGKLAQADTDLINAGVNTEKTLNNLEIGLKRFGKNGGDVTSTIGKSADKLGELTRTTVEDISQQDFSSSRAKAEAIGAATLDALLQGVLSSAKIEGRPELAKLLTQVTGDTKNLSTSLGGNVRLIFSNLFETLLEQVDGFESLNEAAKNNLKRQLQQNADLFREARDVTVGSLKGALAPVGEALQARDAAGAAQTQRLAAENLEKSRKGIASGEGRIGIVFSDILRETTKSFMSLSETATVLNTNHEQLADVSLGLARKQLEFSKELQAKDLAQAKNEIAEIISEFASASEAEAGAKAFADTLQSNLSKVLEGASKGTFNPQDVENLKRTLADTLKAPAQIDKEGLGRLEKISKIVTDTIIKGQEETFKNQEKLRQAELQSIRALLTQSQERLDRMRDEASLLEIVSEIEADRASGVEKLVKQQDTLRRVTSMTISAIDQEVEQLKLRASTTQAGSESEKVLNDQIRKLTVQRQQNVLKAEKDINKLQESLLQERVNLVKKEIDDIQSIFSGRNKLTDILDFGKTDNLAKFQQDVERNASSFKLTSRVLQEELNAISKSNLSAAAREQALKDLRIKAAKATLDAAVAEAEIMKQRADALKGLAQDAANNEEQILAAEGAVLDATRNVSEAFRGYLNAIQDVIAANAQFSIQAGLASIEARNLTGSFAGVKEQLISSERLFNDVAMIAEEVGAGEKIIADIRRESIANQIRLFEQLLSEQTALADSYFTSTTESQAELFRSIQALQGVAGLLGGSFDNFKKLGEGAINDIGATLLSLPQNVRQGLLEATDVLDKLGVSIGGFTADQLKTAIQTAALGTSEALDVDPLFAVQERIAGLIERQAAMQVDGIIQARLGVKAAQEQLQEAKAQKEFAQIQLERLKEEGAMLRSKIADLSSELVNQFIGQNTVLGTKLDNIDLTLKTMLGGVRLTGDMGGGPGLAFNEPTISRQRELLESRGDISDNLATLRGAASADRLGTQDMLIANTRAQESRSNLPTDTVDREIIAAIEQLRTDLNDKLETSNERLESIDTNVTTTSPAAATLTTQPQTIDLNINAQETVQVVGLGRAVDEIVARIKSELGNFVTQEQFTALIQEVLTNRSVLRERGLIIEGPGAGFST